MTTTEFQVTGMTCCHCEHAVSSQVGQLVGVDNARISAVTGRLIVASSELVADPQVLAAVDEAGYTAVRG